MFDTKRMYKVYGIPLVKRRKTKTEKRAAWLKQWHDRAHVPHKSFGECRSHHGGDCTCGAEEANNQLKELFK